MMLRGSFAMYSGAVLREGQLRMREGISVPAGIIRNCFSAAI
jgi:hypothetical protein